MPEQYAAPFRPLPCQIAPWQDKSSILLLTGSAGGGKSRLAAEKLHAFCQKYPGSTALVLRKARESLTNSTVAFLVNVVMANCPFVSHVITQSQFRYSNGSVLIYAGMYDDAQRQQVRSIGQTGGIDIAWMEEATAFSEDDFNEVLARLRGTAADWRQMILTTNPDAPQHWINKRLILGSEAHVYFSSAADNTYNPADYIARLNAMSGVLGDRLARGQWVVATGAVYEDWDPQVHIVNRFPIPSDWRRIRAADFGFTNPFVVQWWAIDNDGRMYLYRELYAPGRIVEDWAALIKEYSAGERIEATVCDHDAEDRATLTRHGISTIAARKDISLGIQAVSARLRKPANLFIMRDASVMPDATLAERKLPQSTAEEFGGYAWPSATDGKAVRETPVKVNDHGLDALRYACMYVDRGQPRAPVPGHDRLAAIEQPVNHIELVRTATGVRFGTRPRVSRNRAHALTFGK
jgi:PBSX family phage terminase large subunit